MYTVYCQWLEGHEGINKERMNRFYDFLSIYRVTNVFDLLLLWRRIDGDVA